jgi:hypothetical protein
VGNRRGQSQQNRGGNRLIVRADEKLAAFLELEWVVRRVRAESATN